MAQCKQGNRETKGKKGIEIISKVSLLLVCAELDLKLFSSLFCVLHALNNSKLLEGDEMNVEGISNEEKRK